MGRKMNAVRGQQMLMPPDLNDWIGDDNPARFIDEFAGMLDMKEMGFREAGNEHGDKRETDIGRPYYGSELLLRVWLYGYFHSKRSSREVEALCKNDMGMMWLTGRLEPDHNTLWRFWKNNREALEKVFVKAVVTAKAMKLVGMELAALDGTKVRSVAGPDSTINKAELKKALEDAREKARKIMEETEAAEERESKLGEGGYAMPKELRNAEVRRRKLEEALATIEETGRKTVCVTEPEARIMKGRDGKKLSYNGQAEVDDKERIIVGVDVFTDENDTGMLGKMTEQTEETLGGKPELVVADKGYYSPGELARCEKNGQEVLVSLPSSVTGVNEDGNTIVGRFHKSNFIYDEERDVYICPLGKCLEYAGMKKDRNRPDTLLIYRCKSYKECACRYECYKLSKGRVLDVNKDHRSVMHQIEKQKDEDAKKALKRRKAIVECVFGWIKGVMGFRRFTYMGLSKVRTQWRMVCTAVNLRTIFKAWKESGGFASPLQVYE